MMKYKVFITVYHSIEVEAANKADALEQAEQEIWDDHIKDVAIKVEQIEEGTD